MLFGFFVGMSEVRASESDAAALAVQDAELVATADEAKTIRISEIREYLENTDGSKTCMDEIFKRRRQLILKLSLKPVLAPIEFAGSVFVLAKAGQALGSASHGEMADLAGAVTGMFLGGVGVIIYTGIDTTLTAVQLHRTNLILKALGEQYFGKPGVKTDELYSLYLEHAGAEPLTKDQVVATLIDLDREGALCDGRLKKQPRIRIGSVLKHRVANSNDFVKYLVKVSE
ncbi:MAG: hypothetical protein EBX52_11660 [Proteobacteria bacterium]|nr:hypothetical protein [Pseudomonadota bacterium]